MLLLKCHSFWFMLVVVWLITNWTSKHILFTSPLKPRKKNEWIKWMDMTYYVSLLLWPKTHISIMCVTLHNLQEKMLIATCLADRLGEFQLWASGQLRTNRLREGCSRTPAVWFQDSQQQMGPYSWGSKLQSSWITGKKVAFLNFISKHQNDWFCLLIPNMHLGYGSVYLLSISLN